MNLRKVRRIVRREYLESVRKKSFLLGLVATPLMMGAMIFLPFLSQGLVTGDRLHVSVLDRTGRHGAAVIDTFSSSVCTGSSGIVAWSKCPVFMSALYTT